MGAGVPNTAHIPVNLEDEQMASVTRQVTIHRGVFKQFTHGPEAMLLETWGHHSTAAKSPPRINERNANQYVSYFESATGEQALFIFDRDGQTGALYLGDTGWDNAHAVVDGTVPDLVLSEPELLWLGDCWRAATEMRH
jgi:hypothetical protein